MINKGQLNTILIRIVTAYALATGLWIILTEVLAHSLIHDLTLLNRVTMLKGMLFVVVSSSVLYFLLQHYVARIIEGTAKLRESEARYSTLMENARDGIFIQTGGRFAYLNVSACLMFGVRSAEELIGTRVVERYHPDYHDKVVERIRIINEERRPVSTTDEKCLRMDGTAFDVDLQAVPFNYKGENGALVFFSDISRRKRAEQDLKDSETRYRAILEAFDGYVYVCSRDYRVEYMNERFKERTGHDATGESCYEALHGLDSICPWCVNDQVFSGKSVRWEVQSPKDNRWYDVTNAPIYNADGTMSKQAMIIDITERKQLEENLRQSQRMESIGTLAGGVAHDFNNILTVIMGCCTMLSMKLENDPALEPFVRQIIDSSERAAKLTHSLLAFSRKQAIKPLPADINDIVLRMKDFLERIIGEDVRLETALGTGPLLVSVDRGQIEQVLMNLAVNARDAMPDGGVLRIETALVDMGEISMELEDCSSAKCVLITVKDTGIGMDKAVRDKIFEPFFTTKESGRGTGLGLSMAYGIIKQHGGTIRVCSEPDKGAEFLIYLPVRKNGRDEVAERQELPLPTGTETILLVEDDDAVRELNGSILASVGYDVMAASNGDEALELFESRMDSIALVILDVIMPGMNGKELHDRLRLIRPRVKVLFASGYSADILLQKGFVPEDVNFISKPFAPYPFLSKVRELIDG